MITNFSTWAEKSKIKELSIYDEHKTVLQYCYSGAESQGHYEVNRLREQREDLYTKLKVGKGLARKAMEAKEVSSHYALLKVFSDWCGANLPKDINS